MMHFADTFFPGGSRETYLESCGVADLITSCFGGRNRKVGEAFAACETKVSEQLGISVQYLYTKYIPQLEIRAHHAYKLQAI